MTANLRVTAPTDREIELTRAFATSPDRLFDAYTRPELLRQWFGPDGHTLVACELDLRVGGRWRFTLRAPDGTELTLHGIYQEIVRPSRLVHVESSTCEAQADCDVHVTTTFLGTGTSTLLTVRMVYPTRQIRDAVLASGMADGLGQGYDRLARCTAEVCA